MKGFWYCSVEVYVNICEILIDFWGEWIVYEK